MSRLETFVWALVTMVLFLSGFSAGWLMAKHFTESGTTWRVGPAELKLDETPLDEMGAPAYHYWQNKAAYSYENTETDA